MILVKHTLYFFQSFGCASIRYFCLHSSSDLCAADKVGAVTAAAKMSKHAQDLIISAPSQAPRAQITFTRVSLIFKARVLTLPPHWHWLKSAQRGGSELPMGLGGREGVDSKSHGVSESCAGMVLRRVIDDWRNREDF
jgi:hypothetical protein